MSGRFSTLPCSGALLTKRGYRVVFCWVPAGVTLVFPGMNTLKRQQVALHRLPLSRQDVFQFIRLAIVARWQRRWQTGVATSKMGEITTSVLHDWTYTNIRGRRTQIVLARLSDR
ncbi:hypothetical protein E2C01_058480 [Portunus trituberculatus]|uniref:Uncharacterized protein n=1 Tax=Portunus trituberculatus TaxID=210409 RepID=A0A5B7H3A8_PORTR|nr:hypothetical protein [Portunus trituberculatus]